MIFLKYCLILLFNCITFNEAYKILGVFASSSTSHTMLGKELLKTLAEHGHEVTMISTSPLKTPIKNYRDIVVNADLKKEYLSKYLIIFLNLIIKKVLTKDTIFCRVTIVLNLIRFSTCTCAYMNTK